jgi:hypothetical protein
VLKHRAWEVDGFVVKEPVGTRGKAAVLDHGQLVPPLLTATACFAPQ